MARSRPSTQHAADPDPVARPRIMGLETEYGISMLGSSPDDLHPMYLANYVIRCYAELAAAGPTGWDFSTESPLLDQRGFTVAREQAYPEQLTDVDTGLANLVLTNGARLYVDHAHPEYSGPEVSTALDAVRWDRAGDALMVEAVRRASSQLGRDVRLYKNNTDGKGASYGTHENYLLSRQTPFPWIIDQFTGFLVSRIPLIGAGRVGLGQTSAEPGYQISQRADFFETDVGLETTLNRPIVNTRDEPHADPRRHRRLHVITGDANQCDVANWVKLSSASLVLRAIEAGLLLDVPRLAQPVAAMSQVSHDLSCSTPLAVLGDDGEPATMTALELQQTYLDGVQRLLASDRLPDADAVEGHTLCTVWGQLLSDLRTEPARCADRLDWVAKWQLLQRYAERDRLSWDAPKLQLIDLQFADLDPRRSLFATLAANGRIRRLVDDESVQQAVSSPPSDTRAYFRGEVMRRYGHQVAAASWESVIFALPGQRTWKRLPMSDPYRGSAEHVEALLDAAPDAATLLLRLGH